MCVPVLNGTQSSIVPVSNRHQGYLEGCIDERRAATHRPWPTLALDRAFIGSKVPLVYQKTIVGVW